MESNLVTTFLVVFWLTGWVVGGVLVIAASLLRCPKCRRWHSSKEEQEACRED